MTTKRRLFGVSVPMLALAVLVPGCSSPPSVDGRSSALGDAGASEAPRHVAYSPTQLRAANIETATVEHRPIAVARTAPGRLRYDDRRHVEIKTAVQGIVRELPVMPGDRVEAGDLLAVVASPEMGQARADLLKLVAERQIAERLSEHASALRAGLAELVRQIEQEADPQQLASHIESFLVGEYREEIVSAYTTYRVADSLHGGLDEADRSGALTGRQIAQRRADHVTAKAALRSAIEHAVFHAEMECAETSGQLADAKRRVTVGREYVAALEGRDAAEATLPSDAPLTELRIVAPFGGTIESRNFSVSERVAAGDSLFVLADTSTLWVEAEIREAEWDALGLEPGEVVVVTGATLGTDAINAEVLRTGRAVSPDSNAAPLVATIENADGRLRPGQFVQVRMPVAAAASVLAVPRSAVMDHEGQSFVFVVDKPGSFRRVDVRLGSADDPWVEVVAGLQDGDEVVTRGAFDLKSELLLDRSEE